MTIKFSHTYLKMPDGVKYTYLVGASVCNLEDLPKDFIDWDTSYFDEELQIVTNYPLPRKGMYIVLTLFTLGHIWTTIRRFTPSKSEYYAKNIGKLFDVEMVEA